jgi:transposase InsO family protein
MHKPHDGGEENVYLLCQEQGFPRHHILWRWNQGKVKGLGKIAITTEHSISNVFLVESPGYNLLFVSQLCHMGYNCLFTNIDVSVFRRSDVSLAFKGALDGKLYLVDFSKENTDLDACLIAKTNMGWL